ncbi:MAG: copper amine oxidase N-terminal domain-containing protein [Firmicutes bacterium]|nr:copper amine oxidase N-terminal domain-containing protein [Bacillota bacterium]
MKFHLRSFLAGVLLCAIVFAMTLSAAASQAGVSKTLYYKDIKVSLDGSALTLTDSEGRPVEPFIIEGTTYLPVRAISQALGLTVDWDETTNTVLLTQPASPAPAVKVSLTLKGGSLTAGGAGFVLHNDSDRDYWFSEEYFIEQLTGDAWKRVEPKDDLLFLMSVFRLQPGAIEEFTVHWVDGYGLLPPGTYRLVKPLSDGGDGTTVYAEFEIR